MGALINCGTVQGQWRGGLKKHIASSGRESANAARQAGVSSSGWVVSGLDSLPPGPFARSPAIFSRCGWPLVLGTIGEVDVMRMSPGGGARLEV